MRRLAYIGLLFLNFSLWGQKDSLLTALQHAIHDTDRCKLLSIIIEDENDDKIWPEYNRQLTILSLKNLQALSKTDPNYSFYTRHYALSLNNSAYLEQLKGNIDSSISLYNRSLRLYRGIQDNSGTATCLNNLAGIYLDKGNHELALIDYLQSLEIFRMNGNLQGVAFTLNNIALTWYNRGNSDKALEYYFESLKIKEEMKDDEAIANTLNNIATIYTDQHEWQKAIELMEKSIALALKHNNFEKLISFYSNLGFNHESTGNPDKALYYYRESLRHSLGAGNLHGQGMALNNIGQVFFNNSKLDSAYVYFKKASIILEQTGNKSGMAKSLSNIGNYYLLKGNTQKALEYGKKSSGLSKNIGYPENIMTSSLLLYRVYKKTGDHKNAMAEYELYIKMRDSISNESNRKAAIRSQLKYEYEKQTAADSVEHAKETDIKNAELKKQEAEITAKKNQQYALFGGLAMVMVFAGFMYNRFKVTQKQKTIIEEQKSEVEGQKKLAEEKQKEILDSIHYAKRIQLAQIPSEKMVGNQLIRTRKN